MKKLIFIILSIIHLCSLAWGQGDPGLPDSILFGNLNGSEVLAAINQRLGIPTWLKTDDSVTFLIIPISSNDSFIVSRDNGIFYPPLSLWDSRLFLLPTFGPHYGTSCQELLGFAYLTDPRDPQNFLNTHYQWWHIADFWMTCTADTSVVGHSTSLEDGPCGPTGDLIFLGLSDGVTGIEPAAVFGRIRLVNTGLLPGDTNGDCRVNGLDVVYLVNYLKGFGSPPVVGDCP